MTTYITINQHTMLLVLNTHDDVLHIKSPYAFHWNAAAPRSLSLNMFNENITIIPESRGKDLVVADMGMLMITFRYSATEHTIIPLTLVQTPS